MGLLQVITGGDLKKKEGAIVPLGMSGTVPYNRQHVSQVGNLARLPLSVGPSQAIEVTKQAAEAKMGNVYLRQYQKASLQQARALAQRHQMQGQHAIQMMGIDAQIQQTDLQVQEARMKHGFGREVAQAQVSGWQAAEQQAAAIWG